MIVWIWTLTAALGALIAIWNTLDAWTDLRALGSLSNGRRLIAVGWVRREAVRVFVQASWAFIGFLALPTASDDVSLIAVLLVATNVALAANTIYDARDRIVLRRIIGPD
jgi:hypothetical protein